MSSHVHKIMQIGPFFFSFLFSFFFLWFFNPSLCFQLLGESLYLLGKYLAYDKKLVSSLSQVESLSLKNALLKEKFSSFEGKAKET